MTKGCPSGTLRRVAAQALGGLLIAANIGDLQWRIIFLINLPIVAVVFLVGIPLLSDTRSAHPARLDWMGLLLCAITLGLLVVPLVKGPEAGWPWWTCLMLIASPAVAVAFWRYEQALTQRGGTPLVSPQLAKVPGLVVGLAGVLFFYVVSAFFLTFSIFLQEAVGMSAFATGMMFIPCGLGFFVGPLTTPAATRRFGQWTPVLGMALEVVGALVLSAVVATTPAGHAPALFGVVVALWLIGFGQGIAVPTLVRSVVDRAPTGGTGMVAGIVNSALQISAALGVAVIGSVFFSLAGGSHTPASLAHAFSWAMVCVAASLSVAAGLVGWAVRVRQDGVAVMSGS